MIKLLTNDLTQQENENKFYPVIYPIVTSSTYKIKNIDKMPLESLPLHLNVI